MKRKLIQLSPSTKVISLPSSWIKKNKLDKGEEIEVQEVENVLYLSTGSKKVMKSLRVDLRNLEENMAFTYCDSAYIAGYDEIQFTIDKHQFEKVIQHVAGEVPGMLISEHSSNKVIFKDITAEYNEDIKVLIRRIINMSISITQEACSSLDERNWDKLRKLKSKDYILNSYISYAQRLINKFGYNKFSKTGLVVMYLKLLEMISDECAAIMKHCAKNKIQALEEFKMLYDIYVLIRTLNEKYTREKCIELENASLKLLTDSDFKDKLYCIKRLIHNLVEVQVQRHL